MAIKSYSTTPLSNTALFPEGMAPSAVNDNLRQVQADLRTWYQDAEWIDWGDSGISRNAAAIFKITGDVTSRYLVNRRIKCYDATTLYGVITASTYSAPDTTITVGLDSGVLTTSLTSVALASLSPSNLSVPTTIGFKGATIASATSTDLSTATGDFIDVSGTTTITGLGTITAGVARVVRFTGALTLTHNSTSLILPSGANITTANGDIAIFRSLGSGNWVCVNYAKASGKAVVETLTTAVTSIATAGLATGGTITGTGTVTVTAAVQSDQETGTSNTVAVTPGTQKFHPSATKASFTLNGSGTAAMTEAYNATLTTDNGVGDWTVTVTTAFSTSTWPYALTCDNSGLGRFPYGKTQATSTLRIEVVDTSGTNRDTTVHGIFCGDQ